MSADAGSRLFADPVPGCGLVGVCLAFPGPDAAEEPGRLGWTGLLFEILRAGGGHLPEMEVTRRFDEWGGGLRATVGHSFATLRYTCLARHFEESLGYLLSFCAPGTAPEDLFEREREARAALVAEERSDPAAAALGRVRFRLFAGKSLAASPLGTESDLAAADPRRLASFAGRILRPDRAFLAVSGEFDEQRARVIGEAFLGRAPEGAEATLPRSDAGDGAPAPAFRATERHPWEQAVVVQAFPAAGTGSPDFQWLSLYAGCLNGLSGPLFEEIRERHGLAYYCSARIVATRGEGLLAFVSGCSEERARFLAESLEGILRRVARQGFSDAEFAAGLAQARAALRLGRQRSDWRAFRMATRPVLGLPSDLGAGDEEFWDRASAGGLRGWAARAVVPETGSALFFLPGGG
ncbi:MAG: M16 family metallopeptidase [Puniceicoccaceae bacterium]